MVANGDIDKLKWELSKEFDMKDLGAAKQNLGMRITRNSRVLKLSQEEYMKKVLRKFSMGKQLTSNCQRSNYPLLRKSETTWPKYRMLIRYIV